MQNTDHLTALHNRLLNEKTRLSNAKSHNEKLMRASIVFGIEREIAGEMDFLGMSPSIDISDDEILKELGV